MDESRRARQHLVGEPSSSAAGAAREAMSRRASRDPRGSGSQPDAAQARAATRSGQGRHAAVERTQNFTRSLAALGELAFNGAQVSASAADVTSGRDLLRIDDTFAMPTAGVGKVLLLIEVAARMSSADASENSILDRTLLDRAGGSGIWRHLQAPSLPMADLAVLVAATGDSMATNVLLGRVGLDAVRSRAESLGLTRTALLDRVRDTRGPDDAPQLSVGSGIELVRLFAQLSRGEVVDYLTSHRVLGWLAVNTDLSMVASAFGLDPLAHGRLDHDLSLANMTGSDGGIRSEAGVLRGPRTAVSYAVTVQFEDDSLAGRLSALEAMRVVGYDLLDYVH